jgi:hypothetical protein
MANEVTYEIPQMKFDEFMNKMFSVFDKELLDDEYTRRNFLSFVRLGPEGVLEDDIIEGKTAHLENLVGYKFESLSEFYPSDANLKRAQVEMENLVPKYVVSAREHAQRLRESHKPLVRGLVGK